MALQEEYELKAKMAGNMKSAARQWYVLPGALVQRAS
jgi:hypothetical protein